MLRKLISGTHGEGAKETEMRYLVRALSLLLAVGFTAGTVSAAETAAVKTMAGILTSLEHFPNDSDKQALQAIVTGSDATPQEKTVARAIMNVQHTASAQDKPKLDAIVKDPAASPSVKTLAGIVSSMKHTVAAADKEKLAALAK